MYIFIRMCFRRAKIKIIIFLCNLVCKRNYSPQKIGVISLIRVINLNNKLMQTNICLTNLSTRICSRCAKINVIFLQYSREQSIKRIVSCFTACLITISSLETSPLIQYFMRRKYISFELETTEYQVSFKTWDVSKTGSDDDAESDIWTQKVHSEYSVGDKLVYKPFDS